MTNPSFETNTTGWDAYGTVTITQDSTTSKYGSYSAKAVTGATGYWGIWNSTGKVSVSSSTAYTGSVWVKGPSGQQGYFTIYETNASDVFVTETNSTFNYTGDWQEYHFLQLLVQPLLSYA